MANPSSTAAQTFEAVGIRAQGMGGAFTAVADDASATWWNPAGLAGGAFFNGILEFGGVREPREDPAWRSGARGFSLALPALGISYYRLRISEIQAIPPTDAGPAGREDRGRAPVSLRSLVAHYLGITVGQSLGDHLAVASTAKLLHGSFASAQTTASDATLDRAEDLNGTGRTQGDLDVGLMATFGRIRGALVVKNVARPTFESGGDSFVVGRQARVGIAAVVADGRRGTVTLAADADLNRTSSAIGDVRRVAAGVEAWGAGRSLGLRAGIGANTVGDARPTVSGGASLAVLAGVYVDAQVTRGADSARRGWGFGLRMTF